MSKPVIDSPFKESWPPSSGKGDFAIEGKAEGSVESAGQFVIGEQVDDAPTALFDLLREMDSKS